MVMKGELFHLGFESRAVILFVWSQWKSVLTAFGVRGLEVSVELQCWRLF